MHEHPYVPNSAQAIERTLCGICWIPYLEHPFWSQKAQAAVIETDAQLDAALRRAGYPD